MMSPPSAATAGRTRVSISSLICETTSSPSSAAVGSTVPVRSGSPEEKCSTRAPSTAGFNSDHELSSALLTETKSAPKNTCVTPSRPKRRSARGERVAASASAKFAVPSSITVRPGRNFKVAGLGVVSVSMNMGLAPDRSASIWTICVRNQPLPGRGQCTMGSRTETLNPQQPHNVVDLAQMRLGDRIGALGAAMENAVDIAGIGQKPPHLAANLAEDFGG